MEIVGLAAKRNARKLAAQANLVRPEAICLVDEAEAGRAAPISSITRKIFAGEDGLIEIARA